jgi:hypothetical protein
LSSTVYTIRAKTDSQGALEDLIFAALEHTEDGGYRYDTIEVPQEYVHDDLGGADLMEQTAWAQRLSTEAGIEASLENGIWKFQRTDDFDGRQT